MFKYKHIFVALLANVLHCVKTADVAMLAFRDSDAFMAGNIHDCLLGW